jgi:hypothetical protein
MAADQIPVTEIGKVAREALRQAPPVSQVTPTPAALQSRLAEIISQAARRRSTAQPIANALGALLGLGQGLTPSGDDLVAGFLLALNRWGARLSPEIDTATLNQEIIMNTRSATSALAASLIECATLGQADERLLLALDGILDGSVPVEACLTALSGWGSSSGYDALVGMALYLMQ